MKSFKEWKQQLEAAASEFNDPTAVESVQYAEAQAYQRAFYEVIKNALRQTLDNEKLSEEVRIGIAQAFLREIVAEMTRCCERFTRQYPDEADGILSFYQRQIGLFNGLINQLSN
jgi:hypothetical protein